MIRTSASRQSFMPVTYKVTHTTKFSYSAAVPVCHNLVHLAPRHLPYQTCDDFRLLIHPEPIEFSHRNDYFGNDVSYFAIDQAHRGLTVTATSQIRVSPRPPIAPQNTPSWDELAGRLRTDRSVAGLAPYQFTAASPSIKPFPALLDYARSSFPACRPVLQGAMELTERIHDEFAYDPRATSIHTPLSEVFEKRHGVCQDFAHLQIACLRSLGMAARYVSGYLRTLPPPGKPRLIGADASHAWLAVYCGEDGWIDLDPTNNALVGIDYITVAWGRDYSDVCPIQGVIVGGGEHTMNVSVDVAPQEAAAPQP